MGGLEAFKQLEIQLEPIKNTYKEHLLRIIEDTLKERDVYYKALCDIESGKNVRMILERTLT